MTDELCNGLIAIYDDPAHAMLDFDDLVAFDAEIAFDAAVASKTDSGEIAVQRSHHAHGTAKVGHGIGAGLAAGVLVSLLPGIGLIAAVGGGAAIGGAVAAHKDVKIRHEARDEFLKVANEALDNGESLVALVCPPPDLERFDQLLNNARTVVQVNVADLTD